MLRCPVAEEDLGWCQAGIIRTDSQTLSCIPGHAGGQRPPCFGTRDLAILRVCLYGAASVPCAKSFRRWRDGREGQWGGGVLLGRERGREGGDLANRSLHYHHSHLPGNRKKNDLVAIVQFAEATPSCFSQKAACEGISPRLRDPCSASPGLSMPHSRSC